MAKALVYWMGILFMGSSVCWGQRTDNGPLASGNTLPNTVVTPIKPAKIAHTEPLYLVVRDLGARRGEREWNVGTKVSQQARGTFWQPFVEYEFVPINRLCLAVDGPFQLTYRSGDQSGIVDSVYVPITRHQDIRAVDVCGHPPLAHLAGGWLYQ